MTLTTEQLIDRLEDLIETWHFMFDIDHDIDEILDLMVTGFPLELHRLIDDIQSPTPYVSGVRNMLEEMRERKTNPTTE